MRETSSPKRGFAALDPERQRQIASAGGRARKRAYDLAHQQPRIARPGDLRPSGLPPAAPPAQAPGLP